LWRRGGLKQRGGDRIEANGSLDAGFAAAGDDYPFEAAVTERPRVGVKCVLARIERSKTEGAVLCGGGANLSARGLVAQDDGDTGQRGRTQIGEATGKGTRLRRLNLNEVRWEGIGGIRLGKNHRVSAQTQRSQHQTLNPVPPYLCHCQRCPGRSWRKDK
jgi:hypothetical protein